MSHDWLMRFLEHRIADRRLLRLIGKWLTAGVLEDGRLMTTEQGTPQGAVISPLLANIYLHYVYDLWVHRWRQQAQGEVIVVRYADDMVVGFQSEQDARRFLAELAQRLDRFGLQLHPEKTRTIEFGRFAAKNCRVRGLRPETFNFLGFTHICGTDKRGGFIIRRHTVRERLCGKLRQVKETIKRMMHLPIQDQGAYLKAGGKRLSELLRRSNQQPGPQLLLPPCRLVLVPRAAAAKPDQAAYMEAYEAADGPLAATRPRQASTTRRAVPRHDPRWEPGAVVPLAGICAGGDEQSSSLVRCPLPSTRRYSAGQQGKR